MLPQRVYEIIRWTIAIAIPAISSLIVSICEICELNVPYDKITLALDAIGLFLGMIFGINKIKHDKKG